MRMKRWKRTERDYRGGFSRIDPDNPVPKSANGVRKLRARPLTPKPITQRTPLEDDKPARDLKEALHLSNEASEASARRRFRLAKDLAQRAISVKPDCGAAHRAFGNAQMGLKNIEVAIEAFSKAADLGVPIIVDAVEWSRILVKENRRHEALALLLRALEKSPKSKAIPLEIKRLGLEKQVK